MKISRVIYSVAVWTFVAGLIVQVFLAGMVVVARQMNWANHISLGHMLAGPLLLILVTAYTGKMPGSFKRLTWLLFAVYVLQANVLIFMRASAPALSALHPVLALADFGLGTLLAWRATALVRSGESLLSQPLQSDGIPGD